MSTADTPDWREPIARAFGYVDGGEVTAGGSMQNDYAWDIADELGAEVEAGRLTIEQAIAKAPTPWLNDPQADAPRDELERRQPLGTTPIGDLLGMVAVIGVDKLCRWIDSLGGDAAEIG